tara:strand:+ start:421 stop:705 length:285 start_codon:yes stop_codon:yes gene_type:complete
MKHKTTPTYFQWLIGDHYFKNKQGVIKFIGTLLFIFMAIATPGPVLEEYYGGWMPIWPVIGWAISVYGGLIGILYQPYGIYKRLKRINWWGDKK